MSICTCALRLFFIISLSRIWWTSGWVPTQKSNHFLQFFLDFAYILIGEKLKAADWIRVILEMFLSSSLKRKYQINWFQHETLEAYTLFFLLNIEDPLTAWCQLSLLRCELRSHFWNPQMFLNQPDTERSSSITTLQSLQIEIKMH